jgi:anaerobic ribonucleoside-triphosphate reductase activating protein
MHIGQIYKADIANGEGVRVSLFVSGCRNHCKGCFNEATWDFKYGDPFTIKEENDIIDALKPAYIQGLTILGGEPFEPENQEVLAPFVKKVRELYPDKTIWMYSGYVFDKEMLPDDGKVHTKYTLDILKNIDVLVDGRFNCELMNLALKFRGSSNQRIILVPESLNANKVILSKLNEYKNFKVEE